MNKLFIIISVAALLLSACSGNQTKEQEHNKDVHTHDDGSVHQNHEVDTIKQEEYIAPADTSMSKKEHPHKH